ncbi:MAG: glycosyltransferase family 2 protein [Bacteroidales bacterium]|nr:glycosyltransferase family 2 protein [Bacteroidales bacterium]
MGFADRYLNKQKGFAPSVPGVPSEQLKYIVVLPAYCEPDIKDVLESLWNCARPDSHVEVLVVINSPENAGEDVLQSNRQTLEKASGWIAYHPDASMRFHILERLSLPARDAGVGLARKIGMDEAVYRFNLIDKPDGFILSFDADSRCDNNYFTSIDEEIRNHPDIKGFTLYFEHPVQGNEFDNRVLAAITEYELHLRYVNQFLRLAGFPYAHHTVGSCFGVRAETYAAQGGMNKKKGGEDFYFLHKIIPLGNFTDIITNRVIPSPRVSTRVPFGTGPAIGKYLNDEQSQLKTYSPEGFLALNDLFRIIPKLFRATREDIARQVNQLPESLSTFLIGNQVVDKVMEINANCSSPATFNKRFYRWFDAFRVVKYLNYASRSFYPQIAVGEAARLFLSTIGHVNPGERYNNLELLQLFRKMERA